MGNGCGGQEIELNSKGIGLFLLDIYVRMFSPDRLQVGQKFLEMTSRAGWMIIVPVFLCTITMVLKLNVIHQVIDSGTRSQAYSANERTE